MTPFQPIYHIVHRVRTDNSDQENHWPVYSDISLSIVFFLILSLIVQFIELTDLFDDALRKREQKSIHEALQQDSFFKEILGKSMFVEDQGSLQRFRFLSDIVFEVGNSDLQPKGEEILTQFAQFLSKHAPQGINIEVEGHTDLLPVTSRRYKDNWELSTERALTVVRLFIMLSQDPNGDVHLDPEKISAIGYGEFRPIEKGVESSTLNRRVEIRLDYSPLKREIIENQDGRVNS